MGEVEANSIVRVDKASGVVTPLGAGLGARATGAVAYPLNGRVNAMTFINGDLYVGGAFISAGPVSLNGIARWDGSSWSAVGAGFASQNEVRALAVMAGDLYAGGSLSMSGTRG